MPYKRGNVWYFKRRLGQFGKVYKSLHARSKTVARERERIVLKLLKNAHWEPLRAWVEGRVSIQRLHEAHDRGKVPQLTAELKSPDKPETTVEEAVSRTRRKKRQEVVESTLNRYEASWTHFMDFVGGETPVEDALTTETVEEFKLARREAGAAKETVNNDLIAVGVLAAVCIDKGWLEERPKLDKYARSERIRYLEPEEIDAYLRAVRAPFRPLFKLLIGTGMRLGEAEALEVRDLRNEDGGTTASVSESKTDSGLREVAVPTWVARTLRSHVEEESLEPSDRLFDIPRRTVQKEHRRVCDELEKRRVLGTSSRTEGYTIHDHRHTAAVHLARAEMPLDLLQGQLGHSTLNETMKYAKYHPTYSHRHPYLERMEANLGFSEPDED